MQLLTTVPLTLLNRNGDTGLVKRKLYPDETLGATLEAVEYGVKAFKVTGGLFKRIGVPENFTIVSINRRRVQEPQKSSTSSTSTKVRCCCSG